MNKRDNPKRDSLRFKTLPRGRGSARLYQFVLNSTNNRIRR